MGIIDILNYLPKHRIEFHRTGIALLPDPSDPDPGIALLAVDEEIHLISISCDCREYKKNSNCVHKNELSAVADSGEVGPGKYHFDALFRKTLWFRLAEILNDACGVNYKNLALKSGKKDGADHGLSVLSDNAPFLTYYPDSRIDPEAGIEEDQLFAERTGLAPKPNNPFHRGHAVDMLSAMTRTASEQILNEKNLKSRRQALEESFWYRLAYHCSLLDSHLNNNPETQAGAEIDIRIEKAGVCILAVSVGPARLFEFIVPHDRVLKVIRALNGSLPVKDPIQWHPASMESIVKVTADDNDDLSVMLYLLLHLPDGTIKTINRRQLKNYWFGEAVYVPEHHMVTTWRKPDLLWDTFNGKYRKKLRRDRVPEILENIEDVFSPPNIIDERVKQLSVFKDVSRIVITPESEDRDWCWLSVDYGFGENAAVSLADIYQAKLTGKRYVAVSGGWVDTRAIDLETVLGGTDNSIIRQLSASETRLRLSRAELLRFKAATGKDIEIRGKAGSGNGGLQQLLEMAPENPVGQLQGFDSVLRKYQQKGVEWLAFLSENGFGGLLCDEMGLGKTHQVMALMVWMLSKNKQTNPFLVICPTTVISHWDRKISQFAPALHPVVYHGTDRELGGSHQQGTVLITSYGILMRDIQRLKKIRFSLAAFDEAQFIKNTDTKTYLAASRLNSHMKVAVTGTPIENRLGDLKALMDLAVPGYLGSDDFFRQRYESGGINRLGELRKLADPFTLRRTKKKVLSELPEKIEDIRFCRLTEAQVRLYREAVDARRTGFLQALERDDKAIPYIHIFSLLTLLKQICNHPASIAKEGVDVGKGPLDSGKWEVFEALVDTCLENGQKIVVFSHFVKMIEIIIRHLEQKGIGFASITGKTRNRGREIDRFNEDENCRVFVGSLKAGGSGIDLIGGSVVIHYDRWWNAAKEDQATDRVHRIGQTRGVQVFKLVTEGTLEEKISAIIERKRKLMTDVIKDDDPGVLKTFTREDLIDLLALPEQS